MDEGGVIVRPVILAEAGLAVVAAAMLQRRRVERFDALLARRCEAEMKPGLGIVGDRALRREDPEAGGLLAVAERRFICAEAGDPQRLQRRVVKRLGFRDVANADRYVVEHEKFLPIASSDEPATARWRPRGDDPNLAWRFAAWGKLLFCLMRSEIQSAGAPTPTS